MTFNPSNSDSSFLPVEFSLPLEKDNNSFKDFISKRERLTASLLNIKEIASYQKVEQMNGQQWFNTTSPSSAIARYSFRKCFDMTALNGADIAPGATFSTAHGITGLTIPTRIFGTATTKTTVKYLPLPYSSATVITKNIEIWADGTNVNITNGATQLALTQVWITLEYVKQ
jgi:hypothetical protein